MALCSLSTGMMDTPCCLGRGHHQGTGGHQGLFVGQGHRQTGVDGGQGGFQAHRAHHGGDHQVGPGCHRHLPGAGPDPRAFPGRLLGQQLPQAGRLPSHLCTETRAG